MPTHYTIGLDFGTNSVRALVVDVATGDELGACVWDYPHGSAGIILDANDPNLARQHPADYLKGVEASVAGALAQAGSVAGFSAARVIGIGVDTTGSTPLPIDEAGVALALKSNFETTPDAMAWLWKDHTSTAEAEEITALAEKQRPQYLAKCGGRYSSEWFWAKLLRCARVAPGIFAAAYTWVECCDWITAALTGSTKPDQIKRGICAAGHKAMFNPNWGGYPDVEFLSQLDPGLVRIRKTLPNIAYTVADSAGGLTMEWASKLGLNPGIPVAVGAFDAHLGAVGSGIGPGTLVKIMGTSTCDIMVSPMNQPLADVPGMCGIVPESVLPECFGIEAGQSAVGDIFNWFVNVIRPGSAWENSGGSNSAAHAALTAGAAALSPGESGLLCLDWHNGNRTILVDQRLTGMILGLTLHSSPAEIYRTLIEATAMGARVIIERMEQYGVKVQRVINCGGIAARSPLAMQIYADVFNRPLLIARSLQTCALGSAVAASVVAGESKGGHATFAKAAAAMTGVQDQQFHPNAAHVKIYERLFQCYRQLHDAFGISGTKIDLSGVMKELLVIRDSARKSQ